MGADMQPGPEMDRLVAEAVGIDALGMALGRAVVQGIGSLLYEERMDGLWEVECSPSRHNDDAIAALEATGECFSICKNAAEFPDSPWEVEFLTLEVRQPQGCAVSLPLAACRAILAWREAKKNG